jgi:hypothetical protein
VFKIEAGTSLRDAVRLYVLHVYESEGKNQTNTAKALRVSPQTVKKHLTKYGVETGVLRRKRKAAPVAETPAPEPKADAVVPEVEQVPVETA